MYLVALILPPLAILMTGRLFQAVFSCFLLPFYFPSALWAILVVADHKANRRTAGVVAAIRKQKPADVKVTTNVVTNVQVVNHFHDSSFVDGMLREQADRAERARLAQAAERKQARNRAIRAAVLGLPALTAETARSTRVASVRAYHALPEWAQPVVWGLAAGTPPAIIAGFLLAAK